MTDWPAVEAAGAGTCWCGDLLGSGRRSAVPCRRLRRVPASPGTGRDEPTFGQAPAVARVPVAAHAPAARLPLVLLAQRIGHQPEQWINAASWWLLGWLLGVEGEGHHSVAPQDAVRRVCSVRGGRCSLGSSGGERGAAAPAEATVATVNCRRVAIPPHPVLVRTRQPGRSRRRLPHPVGGIVPTVLRRHNMRALREHVASYP
jgi:hypothetical protein